MESIEAKIFVPYDRLLKNGRVIQGEATNVDNVARSVRVTKPSGEVVEVPYDFLVIATGRNFPIPFSAFANDVATNKARSRELREAIAAATSVTIVGGGPIGVEVAGEISTDYPTKRVHLVHPHAELLSSAVNGPLSPVTRAKAAAALLAAHVVLHLNARAPVPGDVLPAGVRQFARGVFTGPLPLTLSTGEVVTSEVTLFTTGGVPNSTALGAGLASAITPTGNIRVLPTLQVEGHPNIFALGDITNIEEAKTIMTGKMKHVPVVHANLLALARALTKAPAGTPIASLTVTLKQHVPATAGFMSIPIGRNGGVTQLGGTVLGGFVTRKLKGGDYFVGKTLAEFNYPASGIPPTAATAGVALKAAAPVAAAVASREGKLVPA